MVSFSCEGCGDVLTKKKLDPHRNKCYGASFTCLDCMVYFQGIDYRSHTSCISEAQKYQGALYRPEKDKKKNSTSKAMTPHNAYVEDTMEDDQQNSHITIVEPPMPSAPSPPPAVPEFNKPQDPVNVFDFLVNPGAHGSQLELDAPEQPRMIEEAPKENHDRGLVRVRFEHAGDSLTDLVEYGSGPIHADSYQTPLPKSERDREQKKERKARERSREEKSDKKRKRLYVDTHDLSSQDRVMTDTPPILHSGLTGGLKGLLSRQSMFPSSLDYSRRDLDASPGSPLKKTRYSKHERERGHGRIDSISNNVLSLVPSTSSREHSEDRPRRKKHHHRREESERPSHKMIEYQPMDGQIIHGDKSQNQMVVFQSRAELLLSYINKGPESERGVSMNKVLKRYHRERHASGTSLLRADEEKELWRNLRIKRNERGEIVLFL